ncbi:hypothetical protein VSH64_03235 [Amycolatopsis rhabdoformis]|uniref:Uncharacterized protein n=1 Tax=Amycolatopsis rhabdoformis TaxID=1448059 RepID=A0ABZ1IAA3_9PSEU|nr:hypothetical protein [Amycolatopsis rhabdoformis]WSE31132.1 hypothetical protein VSH64_03235 [Amycolatopsis rhabdoformis]
MTEPNRPYRWDLVRPDRLGALPSGAPELWFLRELTDCAAKVLARSEDGDLYFVGRSADSVYDLLSGALTDRGRLRLLPLSLGLVDNPLLGPLTPAETAQLRANFADGGLSPAALAAGGPPVVFTDLVSSGGTFATLLSLLRAWSEDDGVAWVEVRRRLRLIGITWRHEPSPQTWRWHQNTPEIADLTSGAVRNVSLAGSVWHYFGDTQPKLTRSFTRRRWTDDDARAPRHDDKTREALAEALAVVAAGRTAAVRDRLVRTMVKEPAIAQPWLRALITELKLPRQRKA